VWSPVPGRIDAGGAERTVLVVPGVPTAPAGTARGMTDQELTARERLIADLIELEHKFPGGYQVALGIRLKQSIEEVERLFAVHNLPMREQLVAELTLWHSHAEDGVRLMEHGYHVLHAVIQFVSES
jgi:hypothetical protein